MSEKDGKNNSVKKIVETDIKKSLDPLSVIIPPVQSNQQNQEKVSQQPATSKPTEDQGKK